MKDTRQQQAAVSGARLLRIYQRSGRNFPSAGSRLVRNAEQVIDYL